MTVQYTIDDIVENFAFIDDWEEKYRYLLELGDFLEHMNEEDKTEINKVDGCTSQVWLKSRLAKDEDGYSRLYFQADSDAHIVRGLIAVLLAIYNGKMPKDIISIDTEGIFTKLGLQENLSPTRRNGFFSMVKRIQDTAAMVK